MLSWADAAEKPRKELLECTEVKAEERKHRLTGMGCREVPHQPGLPCRRGRTRSCRSECSTQPGPAEHKAPLYLCNLSPRESTPPCKHHQLSLLSLCSHRTSLPSAPTKASQHREEAAVPSAQGSAGTPTAVRKPCSTAGCQHCAITPTEEHSSTSPPPCHAAELLKLTLLLHITTTVILFPLHIKALRCSSPLRFVSATPAFGWVQNPVQKEWPDRN